MNILTKRALYALLMPHITLIIIVLWSNYGGKPFSTEIGTNSALKRALFVYNPSPIYNLDKQICMSFAKGLSLHDFSSQISTISIAEKDTNSYNLYVFCANTYIFAPDWPTSNFIKNIDLTDRNAIAITIGAGTTSRAERIHKENIKETNATLIDSKSFWLMYPNNEKRLDDDNVEVAKSMATAWGYDIGMKLRAK
jgi:hypothetical protein